MSPILCAMDNYGSVNDAMCWVHSGHSLFPCFGCQYSDDAPRPPFVHGRGEKQQLATGASKAGEGRQERVDNYMTMSAGDDKRQECAADYEGRDKVGEGGKGDGDGNWQ